MRKNRKKKTVEDVVIDCISYGIMGIFAIITLFPFVNILSKAFSEEAAVVAGKVGLFPIGFQFDTMLYVLTGEQFLHSFLLSVFITLIGTGAGVMLTGITAYPLSKHNLPGIKFILVLFVFTMMFNGGMIPTYLLFKQLKLVNTIWVLILPGLLGVYNMLVIKSYYEGLPESIEESAKLDGASNVDILFRIVMPLSMPVFATITLFSAVALWNDYMTPMIYITRANLKPLQLYLRDIVMEVTDTASSVGGESATGGDAWMNIPAEGVRAATIIASTVPILCVYPFLQKYFIKGVLIGSVKG